MSALKTLYEDLNRNIYDLELNTNITIMNPYEYLHEDSMDSIVNEHLRLEICHYTRKYLKLELSDNHKELHIQARHDGDIINLTLVHDIPTNVKLFVYGQYQSLKKQMSYEYKWDARDLFIIGNTSKEIEMKNEIEEEEAPPERKRSNLRLVVSN